MWIKRDAENLIRELGKQFPVVFVTGAPTLEAAKGFNYFRNYYGEDSVLKQYIVCRVKKNHAIGKDVKAVNGI